MDTEARIFPVADYIQPAPYEPIRAAMLETSNASIVVWYVLPGQEIVAHTHPGGQDTWVVLSGNADYYEGNGIMRPINANEIAVAMPGQIHGAKNTGLDAFVFVSIVTPNPAGFVLAEK